VNDMRSKLIEAVDRVQRQEARQRFEAMPDEDMSAWICTSLGLPAGTRFTDEQLEMLLEHGNASEGSERR
jgi:hypothetical protein